MDVEENEDKKKYFSKSLSGTIYRVAVAGLSAAVLSMLIEIITTALIDASNYQTFEAASREQSSTEQQRSASCLSYGSNPNSSPILRNFGSGIWISAFTIPTFALGLKSASLDNFGTILANLILASFSLVLLPLQTVFPAITVGILDECRRPGSYNYGNCHTALHGTILAGHSCLLALAVVQMVLAITEVALSSKILCCSSKPTTPADYNRAYWRQINEAPAPPNVTHGQDLSPNPTPPMLHSPRITGGYPILQSIGGFPNSTRPGTAPLQNNFLSSPAGPASPILSANGINMNNGAHVESQQDNHQQAESLAGLGEALQDAQAEHVGKPNMTPPDVYEFQDANSHICKLSVNLQPGADGVAMEAASHSPRDRPVVVVLSESYDEPYVGRAAVAKPVSY